jgi:hypothetical protein
MPAHSQRGWLTFSTEEVIPSPSDIVFTVRYPADFRRQRSPPVPQGQLGDLLPPEEWELAIKGDIQYFEKMDLERGDISGLYVQIYPGARILTELIEHDGAEAVWDAAGRLQKNS